MSDRVMAHMFYIHVSIRPCILSCNCLNGINKLNRTEVNRSFAVAGPRVWNSTSSAASSGRLRTVQETESSLLKHICSIEAAAPSDFFVLSAVYKLT